jgi:hypothetical protein
MARRIAFASEDVNESSSGAVHCEVVDGIFRAITRPTDSEGILNVRHRGTRSLRTSPLDLLSKKEVRLRSLRELRRDSLRVVLCSPVVRRRAKRGDLAEAHFSIQASEGWLGGRDSAGALFVCLRILAACC